MGKKEENFIEVDFQISKRFANIAMDLLNDGWSSCELYDIVKNCEALPDDIGKEEYVSIQKFMQVLEVMKYFQQHPDEGKKKDSPKDKPIINQYARWVRNQSMEKKISENESIISLPFYDHNSDPFEVFISKIEGLSMVGEDDEYIYMKPSPLYTLDDAGETIGNLLLSKEESHIYLPMIRQIVKANGAQLVDDSVIRYENIPEKDMFVYLSRIYTVMLLVDGLSYLKKEGKE